MKKYLILTLVSLFMISCNNSKKENPQTESKPYLKGYTKASKKDLATKKINLDGESFPVYDTNGNKLKGQDLLKAMMSGNVKTEFYLDTNKDIKAAVLHNKTKEKINLPNDLIGKPAIPFSATDINGKNYSLKDLKDKIIVINFWFAACQPCVKEIPELNDLVKKYGQDVVFLGFSTDKKSVITSFLEKQKFDYSIIPNSKPIAKDYNVIGFPTHIVISKTGKVAYASAGLSSTTIENIDTTVAKLLKN